MIPACEKCVWNTGVHAEWCFGRIVAVAVRELLFDGESGAIIGGWGSVGTVWSGDPSCMTARQQEMAKRLCAEEKQALLDGWREDVPKEDRTIAEWVKDPGRYS